MANTERNRKDLVLQELNDARSELTEVAHAFEAELEAALMEWPFEAAMPVNCWSGGHSTVSSACWEGNRNARSKSSPLRSPRRCAQRQRSQQAPAAATGWRSEAGEYLVD